MKATTVAVPGITWGSYPERKAVDRTWTERALGALQSLPGFFHPQRYGTFIARVHLHDDAVARLSTTAFTAQVADLKARLTKDGFTDNLVAEAFALVREATHRELGMRQYDTQLIAARVMLSNHLAEMATGEGKTLAALLTVATAALAGVPVHVITANDYLVARDAEHLRPVYAALGLSVGYVTQPMKPEDRRVAYACDVTYCTAKELVFDYLRDRLIHGQRRSDLQRRVAAMNEQSEPARPPLLRGLCMALVDEADSILIDEARTPLILSEIKANEQQITFFDIALKLAGSLVGNRDFILNLTTRSAELTAAGRELLAKKVTAMSGVWRDQRRREEVVTQALAARHLFKRDRDYLLREGKVLIIDETTGRLAEGRVWSRGLQQLIEIKERCEPTGEQRTIAQITYQRVFPRYLRLAGMSGTLKEARTELRSVYGLGVVKIPLHQSSKRVHAAPTMLSSARAKWDAVVSQIRACQASGRPILVGTDSVADSESLSEMLTSLAISHAVLNARNDSAEATIVALAGTSGQITIATNMAGRGTDIPLGEGVSERGGLHVICCQHNGTRRIDRQLQGRCARRGDPGSVATILSLDDHLIARHLPNAIGTVLKRKFTSDQPLPSWLARILLRFPQWIEERHQWLQRSQLMKQDDSLDRRLSFGGKGE